MGLFLLLPITGCAQQQEEERSPELDLYGGLIYSNDDMRHLKKTADSLNLSFLQCVANPVYHSLPQTQAEFISFRIKKEKADLVEARFKQNITLQQIRAEFPEIKVRDSVHVIISYTTIYDKYVKGYRTVLYSGYANGFSHTDLIQPPADGKWVYSRDDGDENCSMSAWYLDKPFTSVKLPEEYAKMIQYVDCMIDTSTMLMLDKGNPEEQEVQENKPFDTLRNLVFQKKNKDADSVYGYLDDEDVKYIREEYKKNDRIKQLLNNAIKEAVEEGNGNEVLELAATGICSLDTILLMKRSRVVFGNCSMDDSPRRHARDIAVLASQTHQWPVFIRAHLNIMNDYFGRMSDASYAEAGRKTYLRELEQLDIPAQRLLLGTIFRAKELSSSHYFGDLNRIGRAFTESKYTVAFEKQVKSMMRDKNLDPFNQCLFFMLYASYCYRQPEESTTNAKINELKSESAAYPEYIRRAINNLK